MLESATDMLILKVYLTVTKEVGGVLARSPNCGIDLWASHFGFESLPQNIKQV